MEDVKEITPAQYAKWYGSTPQYIHKLLKDERFDLLPNILRVKRYGRFYVLEVPFKLSKKSFKETIPPATKN